MEMLAACQLILGLLQNQKLSMDEHQQVQKAFVQIAPKCVEEIQKAEKQKEKEAKK
jgi:hypothetical protein